MSDKWSIQIGSWEWEEARLLRSRTNSPQVSENEAKDETVLTDHRGRALIVKSRRTLGFRPPERAS